MFINKKYVDIAVNYTDEKRKAQGVSFDEEVLGQYKARLKKLAQEKNIREGRDLDWRDWSWIKGELIHLMEDSTGGVINKDEDFRRNVKADQYIYAALNNLIAITSRELGSPEIPVDDFRPHVDEIENNFFVLPVGTLPPNPTELLLTERFKEMIESLRGEYDYIFLDCPPIDIVADASIITEVADMTIFVMRAGQMNKEVLTNIEDLYRSSKYNHMTLILNSVDIKYKKYGYGKSSYGYGYGYGDQTPLNA